MVPVQLPQFKQLVSRIVVESLASGTQHAKNRPVVMPLPQIHLMHYVKVIWPPAQSMQLVMDARPGLVPMLQLPTQAIVNANHIFQIVIASLS